MKFIFNFIWEVCLGRFRGVAECRGLMVGVLFLACGGPAWTAQEPTNDDLRTQVQALQAEVARLKASGAPADRLAELERRIDLLAAEDEKARTGGAAEPVAEKPVPGF